MGLFFDSGKFSNSLSLKADDNLKMSAFDNILSKIELLSKKEQLALLKRIAVMLQEEPNNNVRLSAISGVGSEIWHTVDIDKYIENERRGW